jgi:branched-chain amino acid aminotransferase
LAQSANSIQLDLPKPVEEIERIVLETLARNMLPEANIRIVVTGGVSLDSLMPAEIPSLIVLISPLLEYPNIYYEQGVKVITIETERYIPWAKTINYIPAIIALKQAKSAGAIEALYVNQQKHILEGTTSNFFILQGRQLITPKDDILPGVTRDVVLELAQESLEIVQRPLTFADLSQAEEAFLTASNKEIMPVHHVDDVQIGSGRPGAHTGRLMAAFRQLTGTIK